MNALAVVAIVLGFLVVFPLFWCGIVALIGAIAWRPLAADYPAEGWPEDAVEHAFQSGRVGLSSYNGALTAALTADGVYLRPMLLFRVNHPPVFIPWTAIESTDSGLFGSIKARLDSGRRIELWGKAAKRIEEVVRIRDGADD